MKRLLFEPLDVLMFRNERPFTRIESHVAKIGIVSPITFEGALKSKLFLEFCEKKGYFPVDFQRKLNENPVDFKNRIKNLIKADNEVESFLSFIGHPAMDAASQLIVFGAFFAHKEKKIEHFSMPNDIVRENTNGETNSKLTPVENIKLPKSELSVVLSESTQIEEAEGLVDLNSLKEYLHGNLPQVKTFSEQDMKKPYLRERRTGIQLQRETKSTIEGAFYTAEFLRLLENWGFIVWYESSVGVSEGLVKLGGESKGAICHKIDELKIDKTLNTSELVAKLNEEKKLKLYLATPSYFGGWKPPEENLSQVLGVDKLYLTAAIPGKPIYIGGFDFAMNVEKPLSRWVNSGAVYFYKFEGQLHENLSLPIKIVEGNIQMRCAFVGYWQGGD